MPKGAHGKMRTSERGLVDLERLALAESAVGGHSSAGGEDDPVARDQQRRIHVEGAAVALDDRLGFELRLEGSDGIAGLGRTKSARVSVTSPRQAADPPPVQPGAVRAPAKGSTFNSSKKPRNTLSNWSSSSTITSIQSSVRC